MWEFEAGIQFHLSTFDSGQKCCWDCYGVPTERKSEDCDIILCTKFRSNQIHAMSIFSRSKWKRFSCRFNTGGNLSGLDKECLDAKLQVTANETTTPMPIWEAA